MSAKKELQQAIDRYHELLRQSPNDVGLVTNLAWSYERAGEYPEAVQGFQRALELQVNDHNVYYGLGLALMGSGRLPEAREALERAESVAREYADRSTMVVVGSQVKSLIRRMEGS